jgi:hypothetical protein
MTHTFCTSCLQTKPDGDFTGVSAPFTCRACSTEPLSEDTRVCPSCEEPRHVKLYRYPITLAQAQARGYFNHEERPMHATSRICAYCRAHTKRGKERLRHGVSPHYTAKDLPRLSREKLRVELTRGRIKASLVQMEMDRRDAAREQGMQEGRRLGAQRRWEKHDDAKWAWVANEMRRELQRVANNSNRLRHAALGGDDFDVAKHEFHKAYRRAVAAARDAARVGLGDAKDGRYTWADLVGEEETRELLDLWRAIDHMKPEKKRPGRPFNEPLLLMRRKEDIFERCPITARRGKP